MALDYRKRINELAADNPYAAEYGYPLAPEPPSPPPDISHLLIPLDRPPAPEMPEEPPEDLDIVENPDAPDISHLLQPVGPVAKPVPSTEPVQQPYSGPMDQSGLSQFAGTAAGQAASGGLRLIGAGLQGLARDPLGTTVGLIPGLGGLADIAAPEQPIGFLHGAGQTLKEAAASGKLAPYPGWEDSWTATIANAAGSTLPVAAAAVIPGGQSTALRLAGGAIFSSYAALDEQVQEAIRNGATPEQIKQAGRMASIGGYTEPLPFEVIFNRIPLPGIAKGAVAIAGRLLEKAAAEGGQEAVQKAIQNFAEHYVYNPDQDLTEGLASAFGIGAIVGVGFGAATELAGGEQPVPLVDAGAADAGAAAGAAAGAPVPPPPSPGEEEDEDYIPPLASGPGEDEVEDITGLTPEEQAALPGGVPAAPTAPVAPAPPAPAGPAPAATTQPGLFDAPAPPAPGAASPVTPPEPVSPGGPTRDELRKQFTDHMGVINTGAVADHVADAAQQALSAGRTFTLFPEKGKAVEIVSVDRGMVADAKGQRWGTMPLLMAPGNDFPVFQVGPPIAAPAAAAAPAAPQVQTALNFNQPLPPAQAELPLVSAPPPTLQDMIARAHGRPGAPEKWTPPPPPASPWAAQTSTAPDIGHLLQPIGTRRRPEAPQFAGGRVDLKATPKQQEARNARIGHYRWQPGVNVGIEVPAAGERRAMPLPGVDQWSAQLPEGVAYGRIKGTRARRTEVKAFIGPQTGSPNVFIIDQVDPVSGNFDEPKVMLDFATLEEARDAYISSYSDGRGQDRIGSISQLSTPDFKKWLASKKTLRPFDRKATAEARRQRQAMAKEQKDAQRTETEAAAPGIGELPLSGPEPTGPDTGEPSPAPVSGAPEQGEGQGAGQEVQPEEAPVAVETEDAKTVRSDQGQAQQEDELRRGAEPRSGDLQRQAQGAPGDRAPLRPERKEEQPAQQEVATLSNDSAPARQSSKYKYLGRWSFFKSRPLGGQAQEHVLKEGRASGVEVLFALDANGKVLSNVSGNKDECPLTQELSRAMRDPGNSISLHHNHPLGRSLSPADVALMAHAGANSIWAHGHDGTVARASPTAALKKLMGKLGIERRKPQLIKWITVADEAVLLRVQTLIDRRTVSYEDGNRFHAHLVNVVLHNAGLIDYHSNIDATAFIAKADLSKHLDIITGTVAKLANVSPRTDGRYNNRSTPTLRHRGEVGTAFGPTAGMAGQRVGQKPVHKARPEGPGRKAEPAKVAPPPAPLAERWNKLSLEQKEALLKAAKVSRSPITSWNGLGNSAQQRLLAAEQPELVAETVQERRPLRPPDPTAAFATPQERRIFSKTMGKLGQEGINLSYLNRGIADQYEAAQRLDTAIAQTGAAVPEALQLRQAMAAYSGRTSARGFQTEQRYTKPIMQRLNKIQKALGRTGSTFENFNKYLIAKHAPERNAYLRARGSTLADPSGMSDAEAANIVAAAHPEFAGIAPEVYTLLAETAKLELDSGLISQETYDLITGHYSFYVPLQGWQDAEGDDILATGRGFDVRGPEFHAATGRSSMADSPLAYALQGANRAIVRAEKNRVLQVLNRLVQRFPNSQFWQRDRAVKQRYLYEDPTTGVREIRERWVPPQTLANSREGMKNTVVVKEKGVPHYITIHNTPMLEAVRSLSANEMHLLTRVMSTVLRGIGKLYTTYNPIFIIRNFFRDLQTALITLGEENLPGLRWSVFKRLKSSGGGMHRYLRGKPKPAREADDPALWHAHEFARAGGMVGWMEQHSIEDQKAKLQRAIDGKNFLNKVKAGFEVIENANGAVENAVRLSVYMELRQRGYSVQRAALAGKEVTTNFNRRGQWGQAINSLYLFFNARVQGAARIGRALRNPRSHKVKIAALGVLPAMGFLTSLFNRIAGGDDDDGLNAWDVVPQYEKEKNFIIMNPWGKGYLKIPMSYGYNAFYVVGQQAEAAMANMLGYGNGVAPQTAAWNVYHALANATSPIDLVRAGWSGFVPTLVAPYVEMAENLNYQGAPLYPTKYDPKSPDAELYFRGVSPFWKGVARELEGLTKYDRRKPAAIDVSPESMEHLFNTYFGGLGNLAIQQIGTTAAKLATGRMSEIETRDVPVWREVVGSTDNQFVKQNLYYEVWDNIDTLNAEIKDKKITSKEAKARYPLEYALRNEFEAAQKKLREERGRRKKIDNNTRLSTSEKKRRLDAIEDRMAKIRSGALKDYGEELQRSLH